MCVYILSIFIFIYIFLLYMFMYNILMYAYICVQIYTYIHNLYIHFICTLCMFDCLFFCLSFDLAIYYRVIISLWLLMKPMRAMTYVLKWLHCFQGQLKYSHLKWNMLMKYLRLKYSHCQERDLFGREEKRRRRDTYIYIYIHI